MENLPKRIIIVDDHDVAETGLQLIIDETEDLIVTDKVRNGWKLLEKLCINTFDLIILDFSIPDKDSLDLLKAIKKDWPSIPVIINSMNSTGIYEMSSISNGAAAIINKETLPAQLLEIIRKVVNGKKYISMKQAEIMADYISVQQKSIIAAHEVLTDYEFHIFCLLSAGIRKTEIVNMLEIDTTILNNYINSILNKIELPSYSELTKYKIQEKILQ